MPPYRAETWPRNCTPPASSLKIVLFPFRKQRNVGRFTGSQRLPLRGSWRAAARRDGGSSFSLFAPLFLLSHLVIISSSFYFAATARGGAVPFSTRRKAPKTRGGRDPSTPGLSCLSLAAHFFLSAWPACALRVTKRRPLYRNTRNLTIAKVPPHF